MSMLSRVHGASTLGIDARLIEVEIHMSIGLPRYFLVGLPDRAVSESRDRIEAALKNAGGAFPRGRITVNLAPANLPKEGSSFDLPIALALLAVSGQIPPARLQETVAVGELSLDGTLRPVKGILPMAMEARKKGIRTLILPKANGPEAAVVDGIDVLSFENLAGVMSWIRGASQVGPLRLDLETILQHEPETEEVDFRDVKGQESVKRALEVAAAGNHNLVLVGPPGSGKTMMARRLPTILPPLTLDEALETTRIHSVAGNLPPETALITRRPFRAPHHTVSDVALVGGGAIPRPGEISMAHNGVLFLDEMPEFSRKSLEVMRQPLEDGYVNLSRARMSVSYPGRIMLIASMNPSPSGEWLSDPASEGVSPIRMQRYLGRISGPLLDRIDMHVEVERVAYDELTARRPGESSQEIRERVVASREVQKRRFRKLRGVYSNAQMSGSLTRKVCQLNQACNQLMKRAMSSLNLSARAYVRILKVSRTIADLDGSEQIQSAHVAEAIQYRNLDREGWLGH